MDDIGAERLYLAEGRRIHALSKERLRPCGELNWS